MPKTIYALLVGIDLYPRPVPRLYGCVNDINEFQDFLKERADNSAPTPKVQSYLNEKATRAAVIAGFQNHLAQAEKDDVALFYFCGHGSQEPTPAEFWHLEPDRLDETLVCWDSRTPGQWDLADKELGKLVNDVSAKAGHVLVILDCCHSGSGTRGEEGTVRRAPMDDRLRPLDSFLPGALTVAEATTPRGLDAGAGWYAGTHGRHVLLAACRDDQTAEEYTGDGRRRGAFSYFLLDTLKALGGELTYRDLFARTDSLVRSHINAQTPQIEVVRAEDLSARFLDGAIQPSVPYFVVEYRPDWATLRAGAVHGIARPTTDGTTVLALFPMTARDEDLKDLDKSVGRAMVVEVQAATCRLEVSGLADPSTAATFKAAIVGVPTPRLVVRLEGDDEGVREARKALRTASPADGPSLYVREAAGLQEPAQLRLLARGGRYLITRPENERPLADLIPSYSPVDSILAVRRLEHIVRWLTARELRNPSSGIAPNAVEMTITRDGQPLAGPDIRLDYWFDDGKWIRPEIQIKLKNMSQQTLYCALLGLSEDYEITARFFPTGSQRLQPGEETFAFQNKPIPMTVPEERSRQGEIEVRDFLKLIASTDDFDATLLAQAPLKQPGPNSRAIERGKSGSERAQDRHDHRNNALNRLLCQVHTRSFDFDAAPDLGDWRAVDVTFTVVRPRDVGIIPDAGGSTPLGPGVELEGHPALVKASARLSNVTASSRELGSLAIPSLLVDDPAVFQPFPLVKTTTRGDDLGLSVLELVDVSAHARGAVTPEAPLRLRVNQKLEKGEHILPVAFDGEFFLPLGRAERGAGDTTTIVLERLPGPPPDDLPLPLIDKRSVFGSIRIYFQKILSRAAGFDYPYPILAATSFTDAREVVQEADVERVRALVAGANRILLYIHGITGDTRTMVPSARSARVKSTAGDRSLEKLYDQILSFDYENINTEIQQTARDLKARLAAVGLGPGHGKTLHLVAHSMGGLVSRWFIEREGGGEIVQHLVLLGTPNAGSPWPRLQDWATAALGIALNGMVASPWPAHVLAALVAAVEVVDVTLDQMIPGSGFLNDLAASPDPKVPYTLITGNTAIRATALRPQSDRDGTSILHRLLSRLKVMIRMNVSSALCLVADEIFLAPNDIAVAVASMTALGSERVPAPKILPAACDHISYFRDPAGLEVLAAALAAAQGEEVPWINQ